MQNKTRLITQYSSVALTSGSQSQTAVVLPVLADLTGLDFDLTVNAAGTLVTANSVENAVQRISLSDRNGKTIFDVAGSDLPSLSKLLSPRGSYSTPDDATESTDKYYRDVLGISASLDKQPLTMQVTFASYSALAASGATGATVDLIINGWFGSNEDKVTTRIKKRSISVGVGDNSVGQNLVNGAKTDILAIKMGDESNLTSINFSADGSMEDYSKLLPQQIISLENDLYRDEHKANLFNLFVTPLMISTNNTRLDLTMSGAETVIVYQIARD